MADPKVKRQQEMRADLLETLERELLGPWDGPQEALHQRPTGRYLIGRLAPSGTKVSPEEDEGTADAGKGRDDPEAGYASTISMAMNPSSIGLSFTLGPEPLTVEVTAEWGTYTKEIREVEGKDGRTQKVTVWARTQHKATVTLNLSDSGYKEVERGVRVQWLTRTLPDGQRRAVSVFLVNQIRPENADQPDDSEWLFQPMLRARATNTSAIFLSRSLDDVADFEALDANRRTDEVLFRKRPEYAVGHGCAADWEAEGDQGATEVRTVILPMHELARIDPRDNDDEGLDMRQLGGTDPDGVTGERLLELLGPLADGYNTWITQLKERVSGLDKRLTDQAWEHIQGCLLAHERIVEGICLLADNDTSARLARRAFCFANRAMALQRSQSVVALRRRRGHDPGDPADVPTRWRPFQLAFILMNLPSLVDRTNPQRTTCDLLWFPTGGGKTEAYLGLTAFVLALRRIRPPLPGHRADGGVGVLMRYTLRLLTVQQFQRATALVCACELLRVNEAAWGTEEFTIGLWVGTSVTPNHYSLNTQFGDGAKTALQKWSENKRPKGGTPAQLLSCPWCGADLGPTNYEADDHESRVKIFCSDNNCDFAPANPWGIDGIPAHTADQQIYRHTPSLVIATVDKFAQMAMNGRIQALFGRVQRRCDRHGYLTTAEHHPENYHYAQKRKGWPAARVTAVKPFEPPDLIIQDELHLISGPLGTLVGLYETAVDALATVEKDGQQHPPKIIASTATIRGAEQQVRSLFHRSLTIFPPAGLDATDSYFGIEVPPEQEPGRVYLGVFAPGKSVKTALVRAYATLLSRAMCLHQRDAEAGDTYMTLIGYFNSLRELGGARRLAEDDIPGRMRVLSSLSEEDFARRRLYELQELTSNKTAEEVPKILDWLERQFPVGTPDPGKYPVDVLFASNMISVGVDINRLGLMVVNGQPKTTAEYIQSTSRVGRQTPGVIVTVYNWTRPRDISHYERFRSYHTALYRHVEPTSVTPFSSRARDKGLAGVLTSLVRLGDPSMAPDQAASNFNPDDDWVRQTIDLIVARAEAIVGSGDAKTTRAELLEVIDQWVAMIQVWSQTGYDASPNPGYDQLIDKQEVTERRGAFVLPGSLREIETEVNIHLLGMSGAES